jgi:serine/threonine protein kinase/anti-anti-sigma regulatory factor
MSDTKDPAGWQVGDTVADHYEVTALLGEGGMGRVYKVRHRGWDADMAVKCPRPEIVEREGGLAAFVREAETWVNLALHPHVACCYYVRAIAGAPLIFAEFVDGGSLADRISDGRLYEGGPAAALERVLDAAIQFAWGLRHAHEHRLIHQDVKPANVLVATDGTVKVTDFGLARRAKAAESATVGTGSRPLATSGGMTPAFASPEQASGQRVSVATDVWSWAVSVLMMFTGEIFWAHGAMAGLALAHWLADPRVDRPAGAMPEPVRQLLERCLSLDPARRPRAMADLADTLRTVYGEVVGRRYERGQPRALDRHPEALTNRALSLIDLGRRRDAERALEAALRENRFHPETTYNRAALAWNEGEIGGADAIARLRACRVAHPASPRVPYLEGLLHLALPDLRSAEAAFEEATRRDASDSESWTALGDVRTALGKIAEAELAYGRGVSPNARVGAATAGLVGAADRPTVPVPARSRVGAEPDTIAGAGGGRPAVRYRLCRTPAVLEARAKAQSLIGQITDSATDVSVRSLFERLQHRSRRGIRGGWRVRTLGLARAKANPRGWTLPPLIDRVGDLVVTAGNGFLQCWDLGDLAVTAEVALTSTDRTLFACASNWLLTGNDGLTMWWLGSEASRRVVWRVPGLAPTAVDVSTDGRTLVAGTADGALHFIDFATGARRRSEAAHHGGVTAVAWAGTLGLVMSGGMDGRLRVWDATGNALAPLVAGGAAIRAVAAGGGGPFRRDPGAGAVVLVADDSGVLTTWDPRRGVPLARFAAGSPCLAVHAGGTGYGSSGHADGTVVVWDVLKGHRLWSTTAGSAVSCAAMAQYDRYVTAGTAEGTVGVWELDWEFEPEAPASAPSVGPSEMRDGQRASPAEPEGPALDADGRFSGRVGGLEVEVFHVGAVAVVRPGFDLPRQDAALPALVRTLIARGAGGIVVSLGRVGHVGDVGGITRAWAECRTHGTRMRLASLSPKAREALEITRLLTVFDICEDEAVAIASFDWQGS